MNTMVLVRKELLLMVWFIVSFYLPSTDLMQFILNVNYIMFIVYTCVILSDTLKREIENILRM